MEIMSQMLKQPARRPWACLHHTPRSLVKERTREKHSPKSDASSTIFLRCYIDMIVFLILEVQRKQSTTNVVLKKTNKPAHSPSSQYHTRSHISPPFGFLPLRLETRQPYFYHLKPPLSVAKLLFCVSQGVLLAKTSKAPCTSESQTCSMGKKCCPPAEL